MDMLLAQLPNILLVNGIADIVLGLDPTGTLMTRSVDRLGCAWLTLLNTLG